MDVHVALKRLLDASRGKAFQDIGSNLKPITSVHIDTRLDIGGYRRVFVSIFAADHANKLIVSGEPSVGAAFTKAMQRIAKLPIDPAVALAATLGLTPDGKIAA